VAPAQFSSDDWNENLPTLVNIRAALSFIPVFFERLSSDDR